MKRRLRMPRPLHSRIGVRPGSYERTDHRRAIGEIAWPIGGHMERRLRPALLAFEARSGEPRVFGQQALQRLEAAALDGVSQLDSRRIVLSDDHI